MAWLVILGVSLILYAILQFLLWLERKAWNDDGTWGPEHRDYSWHK